MTGPTGDAALIAEIESYVLRVLVPDALHDWWVLPLPRFAGSPSARNLLAAGRGAELLAYVRTYVDPSFS